MSPPERLFINVKLSLSLRCRGVDEGEFELIWKTSVASGVVGPSRGDITTSEGSIEAEVGGLSVRRWVKVAVGGGEGSASSSSSSRRVWERCRGDEFLLDDISGASAKQTRRWV